ncbi:MAG TPA: hypothetical protein VMY42_19945 [Thermoguttaceae bacterium]|nr:hypothetical protein [Thermoguttaceae bacterium]
MYPIRSVYHGLGGAGAPLPTDVWNQQHYPFGAYGADPMNDIVWYALAFAFGWIAHDYYQKK